MLAKVLIVEDDWEINELLVTVLRKEGYEVTSAYSGSEAKLLLAQHCFQLVILDIMLPGISGDQLLKEIRQESWIPVMMISAKSSVSDKVELLSLGADDYITKPFDLDEVVARVAANLRRAHVGQQIVASDKLTFKNITLNKETKEVHIKGELLSLTSREFSILELLLSYPKKVFTRANIFESVWGSPFMGDERTINVHVSNLRIKLAEKDDEMEYIQTVWGIGFKLKD